MINLHNLGVTLRAPLFSGCLLVSHDRGFVRAVGSRYWLIEGRRLVEVDSPESFFESAREDGGD